MPGPTKGIVQAINAYNNAARGGGLGGAPKASGDGDQFADLVKGAIREAVKIGQRAEKASVAGINDRADLNMVVTTVAEAEVTLQTVVAVRDKVIDAYREIMRMPI
jgi:flagellar hook-basal body complex protein FliE